MIRGSLNIDRSRYSGMRDRADSAKLITNQLVRITASDNMVKMRARIELLIMIYKAMDRLLKLERLE